MTDPEPWPLWNLVVRTPRLELRPDDDAGLLELGAEALKGVHPPDRMPFSFPWTEAPREELVRNLLQHHWELRAEFAPARWKLQFLVRLDGRVIGVQSVGARNFATVREVSTGSWLGRSHQGKGYGTEMRAGVLALAFDHLGATQARSGAFIDNPASRAVSRKLGYVEDGTERLARRGAAADNIRLLVTRERFEAHRPAWEAEVRGARECLPLLVGDTGGTG